MGGSKNKTRTETGIPGKISRYVGELIGKVKKGIKIDYWAGVSLVVVSGIGTISVFISFRLGLYNDEFLKGFLVNLHNSMVDAVIFGILIVILIRKHDENIEFKTLIKKLNLNKRLKTSDASRMINADCILRLEILGKTSNLGLNELNLDSLNFSQLNFSNCSFNGSHLKEAVFTKANLANTNFKSCYLIKTRMDSVNLEGSTLSKAKCHGTIFRGANMQNCDCAGTDFRSSDLKNAILRGSNLQDANYADVDLSDANFLDCQNIDVNQILLAKEIRKAKFDKEIIKQIADIKGANFIKKNQLRYGKD